MRALAEGERGAAGVCALFARRWGAAPTDKAPKESKARRPHDIFFYTNAAFPSPQVRNSF
jgi:hypothetical protein